MGELPVTDDKKIDKALPDCNINLIRVAARFFSGVPHPHLLGVCCPDFLIVKSPNQTLTLGH
jgi:hypothetical protein